MPGLDSCAERMLGKDGVSGLSDQAPPIDTFNSRNPGQHPPASRRRAAGSQYDGPYSAASKPAASAAGHDRVHSQPSETPARTSPPTTNPPTAAVAAAVSVLPPAATAAASRWKA